MLTHSLTVAITTTIPVPPLHAAGRTAYILTGETPESIVYDQAHKLLFAADPALNQVLVIDSVKQTITKTLPIPAAGDMDISPDGSTIVVSSDIVPSLTFIDTASLSITNVAPMPPIPGVFGQTMSSSLSQPVFLASGDVLLLEGATNNIDFGGTIVRWSHATNAYTTLDNQLGEYLNRTPDGSKVLITGLQRPLSIYDVATQSITATSETEGTFSASDPANARFASITNNLLQFFDTNLNVLATVNLETGPNLSSRPYATTFSLDGTKLFVAESGLYGGLYAFQTVDAVNYKLGSLAPLMSFSGDDETSFDVDSEIPLAIDETNRIYGQGNRGMAIDDPLNYYASTTPIQGRGFEFFKPNFGPVDAADVTRPFNVYQPSTAVYFDGVAAANIDEDGDGNLTITTPLISTAGPSNIEMVEPDNSFSFYPAAFTFGVEASTVEPTAGPAAGDISADIVAYGVGGDVSGVRVTVGDVPATVLSVQRLDGQLPNPLPVYDVQFDVPPGIAGSTVDVSLSASGNTATLKRAFTYEPQLQNYPYPSGASPNSLVYDAPRQRLYIAAGNQVDVFSMSAHAFLAPLSLPTLHNLTGYTVLDESVDGHTLAIANFTDQSIALVNLDSPAQVTLVPFGPQPLGPNVLFGANSIAATNKGTFFVGQGSTASSGSGGALYELDPKTLSIVERTDNAGTAVPISSQLSTGGFHLMRSIDATRILLANSGPDLLWSATSDSFTVFQPLGLDSSGDGQGFAPDGAISPDGSTIALPIQTDDSAYQYVFDSSFKLISNDIDPEGVVGDPRYGQFLNTSGALLYLPLSSGISVYDVHNGTLIRRIGVNESSFPYGQVYQSATSDDTGHYLFLLTATGLDVVEDVPPLSVRSAIPLPNTVAAGTVITLRGSNFQAGATITIAGKTASTTVADPQTLTFSLPISTTSLSFTVTNPDGTTYTY